MNSFAPELPLNVPPLMASGLGGVDLAILAVYLIATVVWGAWPRKASQSAEGYLLGGRDVAWPVLLLSIVATETSTVTFLSLPGQSFIEGGSFFFLQITLGYILGRLLVIRWLLPEFFGGAAFTAYEVLEARFGSGVRKAASGLFLLCRTLADGLRLYLTGLALQQALSWDLTACVLAITAVTALYATVGGVSSVVWNDALQLTVYTVGAIVAGWLIVQAVPGGFAAIVAFGEETGRLELFDFRVGLFGGGMTFWSGLIGGAFLSLATHGVDHLMVQRYLCARSQRSAAIALGLSGPVVALQFALFLLIGLGLAAFYAGSGTELRPDQAFASFLAQETPVGVRGLLFAAVIAAAISTLSSSLNASAGVAVKDLLQPLLAKEATPGAPHTEAVDRTVAFARLATVGFAVLQASVAIGAGLLLEQTSSVIVLVLNVAGFTTGVLVGLFLLGKLRGRTAPRVAMIALVAGSLAGVAVFSWNAFQAPEWRINGMWNALIASSTTLFGGFIAGRFWEPHE